MGNLKKFMTVKNCKALLFAAYLYYSAIKPRLSQVNRKALRFAAYLNFLAINRTYHKSNVKPYGRYLNYININVAAENRAFRRQTQFAHTCASAR